MDVIEPTLRGLRDAADAVRESNHAAYRASHVPVDLYRRLGTLIEVLSYLRQTTQVIREQTSKITEAAEADGLIVGSDDSTLPRDHDETIFLSLSRVESVLTDAVAAGNEAWSALGHLKLVEP